MKLPWDKNYLKISFHVIFTLIVVLILWIFLENIFPILKGILGIFGYIFSILAPLWIGLVIAYLIDPLAKYFQKKYEEIIDINYTSIEQFRKKIGLKEYIKKDRKYKSRTAGTVISYIFILIIIILILVFVSYSVKGTESASSIDLMINQITKFTDSFTSFLSKIEIRLEELKVLDQSKQIINDVINKITSFTKGFGTQVVSIISKAGSYIINFALGIAISFYFVKDKDMFIDKVKEISIILIPRKINRIVVNVFSDMDAIFSGYIRGQLTDAMIMAVLISISLSLIGIDLSVLIGIISGISNVIPYIGAFIGTALAMLVGLISGNPMKSIYALIVMIVLQQVDNAIIIPKIVGNRVNLHPVLVVLSLAVGGAVFGLGGMILAVPVTAILKIFLVRYIERKRNQKTQ